MKGIEELQKNWKLLLADGVKVPSADGAAEAVEGRVAQAPAGVRRTTCCARKAPNAPGTSPLDREKREGVFACAGCDLPLFTSAMKFDSGTGWPSFFTTIPGVFGTTTDHKLIYPRTEYHCIRCGGHHGHIFDDGPPPTGKR